MNKYLGYVFVVIALIFGSLKPVFITHGFNNLEIPSLSMMGLLGVMTGILTFFINRPQLPIDGKYLGSLLLLGFLLLGFTLATVTALKYCNIITVAAILALTPLVTEIYQAFRVSKKLSKYFYLGFWMAFCGVLIFMYLTNNIIGIVYSSLAVITGGIYKIKLEEVSKKLKTVSSDEISTYMLIVCGFMSLILLPIDFKKLVIQSNLTFWTMLFLSSICWIYANKFFVQSVKMIGANYVSILSICKPIMVMGLAIIILEEKIQAGQAAGVCILILGVLISEITRIYEEKNNLKPKRCLSSKIEEERDIFY